jgi:uncharacterized protein YqgC (DUF456 family)
LDWSAIGVAILFALLGLVSLLSILLGLPGTWMLLGLAVLIELVDGVWLGGAPAVTFGWATLGVAALLSAVGEVIEAAAGAAGARWGGATRRGVVGAFVGGIVGAFLLTGLVPIPVVGTLVGGLVGAFLGALLGEVTAEQRRHPNESLRAAVAAALGKLAGTFGKLAVGVVVWIVLVRAAFLA